MKKICIYSLILIVIDQLIKCIISSNMILNTSITLIKDFFNITYVRNIGAAFSILEGNRMFLIIVALIVLIGIYLLIKNKTFKKIETIVYTLIISGIIGNLIDRIIYGYVIDYADFKLLGYNMPIFNLADSLIVIGCILLFIITVMEEKHDRIQNNK